MHEKPHLDQEALAELQEVMEDEFEVLIRTYLVDSSDRIGALRRAIDAADSDAFTRSAHSFKGSCVNIGAPRLGSLCLEAEVAGRDGSLSSAAELMDAIELEFAIIRDLLERNLHT